MGIVADWPWLLAGSSSGGLSACCKIKRKSAHEHSKSEMAGPLCTLCVLRVPDCRKKASQAGARQCEELWLRDLWGLSCIFHSEEENGKLVTASFSYSTLRLVFTSALQIRQSCLAHVQHCSKPAGGSITCDNFRCWHKCVCQIN